jgi:hypothetical protein
MQAAAFIAIDIEVFLTSGSLFSAGRPVVGQCRTELLERLKELKK